MCFDLVQNTAITEPPCLTFSSVYVSISGCSGPCWPNLVTITIQCRVRLSRPVGQCWRWLWSPADTKSARSSDRIVIKARLLTLVSRCAGGELFFCLLCYTVCRTADCLFYWSQRYWHFREIGVTDCPVRLASQCSFWVSCQDPIWMMNDWVLGKAHMAVRRDTESFFVLACTLRASLQVPAPSSKLCQIVWLRHWRGTRLYLRGAAVSDAAVSPLRKVWGIS